ncbi:glycogen synthase [Neobacillus cucumis]|nr:hypothetical protein [Neobacillus cucumis]MBM7653462.1 glycogen synthase [Neobacillus cucumis]
MLNHKKELEKDLTFFCESTEISLIGIVNGIDDTVYNPKEDRDITVS